MALNHLFHPREVLRRCGDGGCQHQTQDQPGESGRDHGVGYIIWRLVDHAADRGP
jgi:hypothetical protein